jgi:hypothetical protein
MRPWTVLPHDGIEKLEANLWAVDGALPRGPLRRRMCIARLADGRLLFLNAIPLREDAMREVEAFGEPAFLLVPNGFHRLDIAAFKQRYPNLRVLTGVGSRKRVEEKVAVDGGWELAPRDGAVTVEPIAGTKVDEALAIVRSSGRTSLCFFGDTFMNMPHVRGFVGLVMRLLGSTGRPRVTGIARLFIVGDRAKVREHLLRLADIRDLARLIPSHGHIVTDDPAGVLRRAAEEL